MNVAIRTVSIVSALLWVFLIAFAASAVFSAKDLQVEFGTLQTSVGAENEVVLILPVAIVNRGFCTISEFNISTEIVDEQDLTLTRGFTLVPRVGTGQSVNITHQVEFEIDENLNTRTHLLFDDAELRLAETFSMKLADTIPVQASLNISFPWGAPLYNFTVGAIRISREPAANSGGYVEGDVQVSFENHAFFNINGTLYLRVYNDADVLVGTGQTNLDVPKNTGYHEDIKVDAWILHVSASGHYEVSVQTSMFSVGPLVVPYAS